METLWQDLRYGARQLACSPGFTAVAVLTLALGIGANTAVFSVVNALVLKPLPFENLDRLVAVRESLPQQGLKATAVSPADFLDWRAQNTVFQDLAAYRFRDTTLTGASDPELVRGLLVSPEFFSALETKAALGRTFQPEEDQPGREQVAVLGYGLWQRRYGGDPSLLGSTVLVNGRAATVVGILPPHFEFPFGTEVWMPLAFTPQQKEQRDSRYLHVLAQLKPDVTMAQAQSEMSSIAERIERQNPQTNAGLSVSVIPLRDLQGDFTGPLLSIPVGMAGFLLLIACANVVNLLLARATTRHKEMAIRSAIGAGRLRLVRQLLTESALLIGLAAAASLALSLWAVDLIKASLPADIAKHMPGWQEMQIDARVLLFTLGVTVFTALVFSVVPALQTSRSHAQETLRETGKSAGTPARGRTRGFLVALETALALVLLVGAGLTVKGFWGLLDAFQGIQADRILTLQTPLPDSKYPSQQQVAEFYRQALERMEALPDVQSVSVASNTPLNNSPNPSVELQIEGRPALLPGERQTVDLLVVSPDYFATIGARLLDGRAFGPGDGWSAPPVAVISELAARRYWPGENPLGRRIKLGGAAADAPWVTIVGVVSDVRQSWFDKELRPQLYRPYLQAPRPRMTFLLRTSSDPLNLAPAARAQILAVDRDQPIRHLKTLGQLFVDEMSPFRFAADLMLAFGVIALVLAAVGAYSVMSYSVAQRTQEMGIRLALGARPHDILRLIVGQGARTGGLGLLIGLPLSLVLSRIMANTLFGVVALEYAVLIGYALVLAAVALLASYIPARRAMRVDPMVALRYE